ELSNINATILINKMDLLTDKADHQELLDLMRIYKSLGYSCYQTSVKQPQQIETLLPVFQAQTSVLVGQSGVGKSSIIAKLIPGEEVRVGALSSSKALGKHTTTQAKLYHLTSIHGHLI